MAVAFHEHHNPPWPLVEADVRATLAAIEKHGFFRVTGSGFIAGVLQPNPLSKGWLVASEFLWWGDANLIRRFRKWAIDNGANEIRYSCPPDERVKGFYSKFSTATEAVYSEYP